MNLKTSEEKREFSTGSVRDSATGKPRIDLIPSSTLIKLGIHYGNGAEHYGANNWKKGQPISSYMASFERHYNQFKVGITDENHLISAIWNLVAIDWTLDAIKSGILPKELDDREPDQKESGPMANLIQNIIKENIENKKNKKQNETVSPSTIEQGEFITGKFNGDYKSAVVLANSFIYRNKFEDCFFRAFEIKNDSKFSIFNNEIISNKVKGYNVKDFIYNRIENLACMKNNLVFVDINLRENACESAQIFYCKQEERGFSFNRITVKDSNVFGSLSFGDTRDFIKEDFLFAIIIGADNV